MFISWLTAVAVGARTVETVSDDRVFSGFTTVDIESDVENGIIFVLKDVGEQVGTVRFKVDGVTKVWGSKSTVPLTVEQDIKEPVNWNIALINYMSSEISKLYQSIE